MPNKEKVSHRVPFYRRPVVIVGFLLLVILVAVLIIAIAKAAKPAEPEEPKEDPTSAIEVIDNDTTEENDVWEMSNAPIQYEGENPNNLEELTGSVTYIEQNYDAHSLKVMVGIDQYIIDGTCIAELKNNGQVVATGNFSVVADASTSHCEPIVFDMANIVPGKYQLVVKFSGDGKTGEITQDIQY